MDRYHVALFLHLLALLVASGATAIMKLAIGRSARARTLGEVIEWNRLMGATGKVFPICLAVFFLTGGYMLSLTQSVPWTTGFVVAGLTGVVFLLASGAFLGVKGKVMGEKLGAMARVHGMDHPAPKVAPPALLAALPSINTFVALAVAFDMVTKPNGIVASLGVLAMGAVLGAALGIRGHAPVAEQAPAA